MTSLLENDPPSKPKRWQICPLCSDRTVTTAQTVDGKKLVIERCSDGRGNIGLTDPLFDDGPLSAVMGVVSRYRVHRCKGALASTPAFSAENFDSKRSDPTKSPTDPNISYRTFPSRKRRGKR
jgi:hypothetical protein